MERMLHTLKGRLERYEVSLTEMRRLEATSALARIRKEVSAKTQGKCFYCGEAGDVPDHFIPISKGGSDYIDNLFPSCSPCNNSKKDHLLEDWRVARRMKSAREQYGLPGFSLSQCKWLSEKMSVDVLYRLGVPEVTFWFEREGISAPAGSVIEWKPSEFSVKWAKRKIADSRKFELSEFCIENNCKPRSVIAKLKGIGTSDEIIRDLGRAA